MTFRGHHMIRRIAALGLILATFGVSEEKWVMAQSGTLTIEQLGAQLTGSLENVELVEIDEQDQPIPGGCTATVSAADFDALVE